ncbi:MAG: malate synthase A, partial [Pseudomonadota bacterium]
RRQHLLSLRKQRKIDIAQGHRPDFITENYYIRESDWQVGPIPADLQNRKIEITGPTDRKMVINALNSGANGFMADFEDSNCPSWNNMIEGQINLRDAVRGTIEFTDEQKNKHYCLNDKTATLLVRPRGWHLEETHVECDGQPVSGSIFDFALYLFHNHQVLNERNSGAYFYLPKMENHLEARLWNDIFIESQCLLNIPYGSIKATVLIETLLAAFEMEEIIYELKDHCAGLNCGRWDYIFSMIKTFCNNRDFILPDRAQVTMTSPNLRAYCLKLIQTCHKRGAFAMGGMAAQIPIKGDDEANMKAIAAVKKDKLREVQDGHDGTWVAHPGLVKIARDVFDANFKGDNQLDVLQEKIQITADDLLICPQGTITWRGFLDNIEVGLKYLYAWIGGNGCVPINHLMEDAATAEIARAQLWQWAKFKISTAEGKVIDRDILKTEIEKQVKKFNEMPEIKEKSDLQKAADIFGKIVLDDNFEDFITLPAYREILKKGW